jgi:hypothetical protein
MLGSPEVDVIVVANKLEAILSGPDLAMNQALMMNSERKFDAKPICNDFAKKNAA